MRPFRLRARIPRVVSSSIEGGQALRDHPVLDGSIVRVSNRWKLRAGEIALLGRPAVWFSFELATPAFRLGPLRIPSLRWHDEQDFGGHLFLAVADDGEQAARPGAAETTTENEPATVAIVEAGPLHPNGTGALVPFRYPEDEFAKHGLLDFEPLPIATPNGLDPHVFAALLLATQRAYDGNQRYLVIEIPFLRVGRDSNSYAVGVLLACGVDLRAIPTPKRRLRFEFTGYPGAEDPVHAENFGVYLGAPDHLGDDTLAVAYHDADGTVRLVVVGGTPNGHARLPDGETVTLDVLGRLVLAPQEAARRGLPVRPTAPPEQIVNRRFFPSDPAPQGATITLVVAGRAVPLLPGDRYEGTVVARSDALGLALLRGEPGEIVLPLVELGVEMRDPKRVDRLLRVGHRVTLGLHRDRHPKLEVHGPPAASDALRWRRPHLPRMTTVLRTSALGLATAVAVAALLVRADRE